MSESTPALGETTTAIAFDHTFTYAYATCRLTTKKRIDYPTKSERILEKKVLWDVLQPIAYHHEKRLIIVINSRPAKLESTYDFQFRPKPLCPMHLLYMKTLIEPGQTNELQKGFWTRLSKVEATFSFTKKDHYLATW